MTARVLVVDDIAANLTALDAVLAKPGVEIVHASSGAQALELLRQACAQDTALVLVCNTGLRSFEAQRVLDSCGLTNSRTVAGGMIAARRAGLGVE